MPWLGAGRLLNGLPSASLHREEASTFEAGHTEQAFVVSVIGLLLRSHEAHARPDVGVLGLVAGEDGGDLLASEALDQGDGLVSQGVCGHL